MKKLLLIIIFLSLVFSLFSDGFIVVRRESSYIFPLEVLNHNVKVKIDNNISETIIDQTFYNPLKRTLEGEYIFPIPKNAVIKRFSMFINGREVKAELLEKNKARRIYERIVRKMKDPALLEYYKNNMFRVRIYPINPGEKKRIKISYTQFLKFSNFTYEYVYPLNTEKFSSKPIKDVSLYADVKSDFDIVNIYSPVFKSDIIKKSNKHYKVGFEQKNVKPDKDYKLYYTIKKSEIMANLLTYKRKNKNGYFILSMFPPLDYSKRMNKNLIFVLDTSGSMSGEKIEKAKEALKFCINNLSRGDYFEIIRFSSESEALFKILVKADKSNKTKAIEFVDSFEAVGGTNFEMSLNQAFLIKKRNKLPVNVVFITDGHPTVGMRRFDDIVKLVKKNNKSRFRIFSFGVGYDVNAVLLDKISDITKGYSSYIKPDQDLEVKISDFFKKISSPAFSDLRFDIKGVKIYKYYPENLPDLFYNSRIMIVGRYKGNGNALIKLSGIFKNKRRDFEFDVKFEENTERDFIPQLWANRRVAHLLTLLRTDYNNKELKDEVVYLSKKYGILNKYTGMLVLEKEESSPVRDVDAGVEGGIHDIYPDVLFKSKKGESAVKMSESLKVLASSPVVARKEYRDKVDGKKIMKYVFNRYFYKKGKFWVDSLIKSDKTYKKHRIKFLSKEYFGLIKSSKEVAEILSIGKNVKLLYKGIIYIISEK